MALIFSEVMDEAGKVTGVGNWGRIEIWENAEKIFWRSEVFSSQVSELFVNRFFSGSSINWLAFIVRQQGFAYGRPESKDNKIRPEFQWLAESQLNKVIDNLTLRFWQIGADNIFSAPSPSDILFCWLQLYSKEDKGQSVIQFIKQTTQNNDDMFLKALNAMRGWQNSSSDGLTHPLRQRTVAFFMDADEAKARLEKLVSKNDKAKELLSAWTDEDF